MVEFGEILKNIGEFGRFQKLLTFMLCFLGFINAFNMFSQVFTGISVPHHCNTSWILKKNPNLTEEHQLNLTIPRNTQGFYERCLMYTPVDWDIESIERYGLNDTQECQDGWVYDTSQQKSTLVTEFDLVCHRKEQTDISHAVYMAGLLVGAITFGPLGDWIGRRPIILISLLMNMSFGVGAAFASHIYVYMALRFLVGASASGVINNRLVLVAEWVGSSQRPYATISSHVSFAFGQIVLAGIGYGIRNWRIVQIVCSAPIGLLFVYYWVLPESARWLLTKGKNEKATELLQKAARMNKKEFSEKLLTQLQEAKNKKSGNMIDLFRVPALRKATFVMSTLWCVNSLVYYGLSLNVGSFGLDIYFTQLIFGLVEVPARLSSMFVVQFLGRKPSQSLYLLVGGTVCLVITAIPKSLPVVTTVLAVIGKFAIAGSFSICHMYTTELFPTVIRQNGLGICTMTARIAGIIAPLISLLVKYHPAIPMAIYGSGPIIGGLLCFLLPETRNRDLQDHTQEANGLPRKLVLKKLYHNQEPQTPSLEEITLDEQDKSIFLDLMSLLEEQTETVGSEVSFLDIKILKGSEGQLNTTLYRKTTAVNSLLHYSSFHTMATKRGIPTGQFLRIRRNCTHDDEFEQEAEKLAERFRNRGYPNKSSSIMDKHLIHENHQEEDVDTEQEEKRTYL
ncbi:solute carrier family 22 member 13-like [Hyperolius riggenbachi]|uniref:solute carrier family 22 member 13-like n=1 Tax=Hyperolius riggenbachi TaxID=752182 RepID=UPI0035A34C9C